MKTKKILCAFGTRPEAVKMAPLILALQKDPSFELFILSTAQHRDMLDQMMKTFSLQATHDLDIMQTNQTLPQLTARLPLPLDAFLEETRPDIVLAQGDTTTTFMTALASFYRRIPFGHIEAGLRSGNFSHPYPEEMNRVLIGRLATLHFAPTELSKENLLKEGLSPEKIFVTGNTVVDALQWILQHYPPADPLPPEKKLLLVTAHRRENIGERLTRICQAIRHLADRNANVQIVFPVHRNPQVSQIVFRELKERPRITLTDPMPYAEFIRQMKQAYLILSDSGGIQEEAATLGIPALILRDVTDRPEGTLLGACRLVGADFETITQETQRLLEDESAHEAMISHASPYGDGRAAERIVSIVKQELEKNS